MFVDSLKLDLPDTFPDTRYSEFMAGVRRILLADKGEACEEFAGASNVIGWRFRGAYEYMREFWDTFGSDESFEGIYIRERAFFGMFACGVSCIESTCYALYALASHPLVLGVPFGPFEQKRSAPETLRAALGAGGSTAPLVAALTALIDADEWRTWLTFRNRMAHRSNLPRIITASAASKASSTPAIEFEKTTSTRRFEGDLPDLEHLFEWLAKTLEELLVSGIALADAHGGPHDSAAV